MNLIFQNEDGTLSIDNNNVVLKLNSENRTRNLGTMVTNEKGHLSYFKKDKEKEVFRKTNAWSINNNVLQALPHDDSTITIDSESATYCITKKDAIKYGQFMHFKTSGIEKKIYIPKVNFDIDIK